MPAKVTGSLMAATKASTARMSSAASTPKEHKTPTIDQTLVHVDPSKLQVDPSKLRLETNKDAWSNIKTLANSKSASSKEATTVESANASIKQVATTVKATQRCNK